MTRLGLQLLFVDLKVTLWLPETEAGKLCISVLLLKEFVFLLPRIKGIINCLGFPSEGHSKCRS